jgi:hypothetical protein
MLLEFDPEQARILRRALEARVRDMQLRLSGEPGDDGFQRELRLATQVLRRIEALERQAGHSSGTTHGVASKFESEDS